MKAQFTDFMKERIVAVPELQVFIDGTIPILESNRIDSFFDCKPYFEKLLMGTAIRDIIQHELHRYEAAPYCITELAIATHFVVINCSLFNLSLFLLKKKTQSASVLHGLANHQIFGVCGPGPMLVDSYRQPNPYPYDIIERSKVLQVVNERELLKPGAVRCLRALEDVVMFEPTDEPSLIMVFGSPLAIPICWEYDRQTLAPSKMVVGEQLSARLEHTANMLGEICDISSLPALKVLSEHPEHHVRWAAVRSMIRIDYEEGLSMLKKSLNDPHLYIRSAAKKSLYKLGVNHAAYDVVPHQQSFS